MGFIQAVIDGVKVVLPWAWEEISESFSKIWNSFHNIVKDPKTVLQIIASAAQRYVSILVLG